MATTRRVILCDYICPLTTGKLKVTQQVPKVTFCHGSMSYRQDFRRSVAPFPRLLWLKEAFSETALPVLSKGSVDIHSVPRGKHLHAIAHHLWCCVLSPAYLVEIWSTPV